MLKTAPKPHIPAGELAQVLAGLRVGLDPGKLAREVTSRHPEDRGIGPRLLDLAFACLWLAERIPIADILTMLECRHRFELSPAQSRAHAVEIVWAVQHEISPLEDRSIQPSKEHDYAAA